MGPSRERWTLSQMRLDMLLPPVHTLNAAAHCCQPPTPGEHSVQRMLNSLVYMACTGSTEMNTTTCSVLVPPPHEHLARV